MQNKCLYKKQRITDIFLRNLLREKTDLQISDAEVAGFQIRYYRRSKKISFFLFYRQKFTGKQRNMKIGEYLFKKTPSENNPGQVKLMSF